MWSDLGGAQYQRTIHIEHTITRLINMLHRLLDEDDRVRSLPLGIARRKVRSNISRCYRPKQGIRDGMQQNVAVRVSRQAKAVGNRDATNSQRNPSNKLM